MGLQFYRKGKLNLATFCDYMAFSECHVCKILLHSNQIMEIYYSNIQASTALLETIENRLSGKDYIRGIELNEDNGLIAFNEEISIQTIPDDIEYDETENEVEDLLGQGWRVL